ELSKTAVRDSEKPPAYHSANYIGKDFHSFCSFIYFFFGRAGRNQQKKGTWPRSDDHRRSWAALACFMFFYFFFIF
ncbi:uncharacterized protein PgNI_04742, partial [Pyricularia grisea]|uniref:Uncharacterized protein n=1 Tax=Pyricularia grisea TaxID=148305 RepID=A0A6P8B9R1_PYRGI